MLGSPASPLATATPLGVAAVPAPAAQPARRGRSPWRLAGRAVVACLGIMAVGTAIGTAVAGAFLLIAVVVG